MHADEGAAFELLRCPSGIRLLARRSPALVQQVLDECLHGPDRDSRGSSRRSWVSGPEREAMSPANALLVDAFGRIQESVHGAVEGLTREQLVHRVDPEANTIAWLVWHLTRIQDDHVAALAGRQQVWHHEGWLARMALPFEPDDHGYGHTADQVAAVDVPAPLLLGYHDAVHHETVGYLESLRDEEYDEVVDRSWDPPVTRAVRLVSVVDDGMQHAGQAAFVRGVVERLER